VQPPGLALIMTVDDQDILSFVRRSYPNAPVIPLTPNFTSSNPQAYAVLIRQQDIAQNLGVVVQFGTGAASTVQSHVQGFVAWPDGSGPSTAATIRGTLLIPQSLMWQPVAVRVAGALRATLTIDGQQWPNGDAGTGTIRLGAGNHKIEIKAHGKASPTLGLEWTAGTGSGISTGMILPWAPIPPLALASPTLPSGGLLGLYYQATDFSGPIALARVDQQVNTYFQNPPANTQFPFSARWQGMLRADSAGAYGFKLDSSGPAILFIDGRQVLTGNADGGQITFVPLSIGPHTVRIDYTGSGGYLHCYFSWQPPGQSSFAPVPPTVTEPAHG
jgi:hypothetical protein